MDNGASEFLIEDAGALSCIFFMKLHLYDMNGLIVPAKHRVLYLWTSMMWVTSLDAVNLTPKRNVVSKTISIIVIALWSDVLKCRMCTSKLAEHSFGNIRRICIDFLCLDYVSLVENFQRQINIMFFGDLIASSSIHGYQATFKEWIKQNQSWG